MTAIVVIASFRLKPGTEETGLAALATVIEATHAEPGCLGYSLHRDKEDPARLAIVERWADEQALADHLEQPYEKAFLEAAMPLLAEPPLILQTTAVPMGDPAKGSL